MRGIWGSGHRHGEALPGSQSLSCHVGLSADNTAAVWAPGNVAANSPLEYRKLSFFLISQCSFLSEFHIASEFTP